MEKEKKQILLTGHTKGIGRETLKLLLQAGHDVTGISRSMLKTENECLRQIQADLSDQQQITSVCSRLARQSFDVIILNAGYNDIRPAEAYSIQEVIQIINVNYTAHAAILRACLPSLLRKKGLVVGIGSFSALGTGKWNNYYGASKAGLQHLLANIFEQYRKQGLRVSIIIPDITASEFYTHQQFEPAKDESAYIKPQSVAGIIFDIISKPTDYVTLQLMVRPQRFELKRKNRP
jgi:short-subunit dehydrogenase